MAQQIQWNEERYNGHSGKVDLLGASVTVAVISWSVDRNEKWLLRMELPGYNAVTKKHDDLDKAKAQAQRILDTFAREIS